MRLVRNTPDQLVIAYKPLVGMPVYGLVAAMAIVYGIYQLSQGDIQGLISLAGVGGIALLAYLAVQPVRVVFDKPSRTVEIFAPTLIAPGRTTTYGLDEVSEAVMATRKTPTQYQIQLVIPEGDGAGRHDITDSRELKKKSYTQIIDVINEWLEAACALS